MAPASGKQRQEHFEFGGPVIGPLGIMLGTPAVCYALVYACNAGGCLALWPALTIPGWPAGTPLFTWEAVWVYLGFLAFQAALHLLLPGQRRQGTELANGTRLTYKLNGLQNLVVTLAAAGALAATTDKLAWAADNFVPLLTASLLFSYALSAMLYASSFSGRKLLAPHFSNGGTPHPIYEFYMGRELNPRLGPLDLKEFCELYPGLIGWIVLDLAMLQAEYVRTGGVSAAMALVVIFQTLYVADGLWFEPAILTTMDITSDGFGFMLVFGDLTWVPFTYSLQARFLADHPQSLSWVAIAGILLLKAAGYLTFRGSNSQKDLFRRDPDHPRVAGLETLDTARGRRLLVSGWWGVARHINYFGDWLMAWAWCLPCGFQSVVPYFYVVFFGTLLVHRDRRDDHACQIKYGKDWDKYKSRVKYRIVPLLY